MKKSKIIVPALGILLLSTAASISGTVAWFTATRTFSTHVSSFGVGSIDGNLKGVCVAGIGTTASTTDSENDTILFSVSAVPSVLTDASYDSASAKLYTDNAVETERVDTDKQAGVNTSSFVDLGTANATNWKAGTKDSKDYYYAVTWTIKLKYTGGATSNNVHMFFDEAATNFKVNGAAGTADDTTAAKKVANGIRFNLTAGSENINYAPLRTGTIKNVSGVGATANTSDLIDGDDVVTKLADNKTATVAAGNKAYLGTVAPETELSVSVTCWLDGLDADVLSANLANFENISGDLCFYCRNEGTETA